MAAVRAAAWTPFHLQGTPRVKRVRHPARYTAFRAPSLIGRLALIGLDTPSHLIAALGWMVGGLVHIALPEFLVRSYPPAAQKLLRNSDLARLGARAFGALTIFLGIVVLLSLD